MKRVCLVIPIFIILFVPAVYAGPPCISGDIDGNCIVNLFDLALFAEQWLDVRDPFIESEGLIVIEAEHYQANSPGSDRMWVAKDIEGSIGDGCVQALPDLGASIDSDIETTSPNLTYEIDFTTTGTYYLWARGVADNASDDSLHYGVDGVVVSTGDVDSIKVNTGSFEWSNGNGAVIALIDITTAGLHTLDIWMREDGVIIDRLLLTTDSGYTPDQPDESSTGTELTADLDGIGGVNLKDYAIISQNWKDSYSPVIITEFMASNSSEIPLGEGDLLDEDGNSSDWIEIYNRSEVTVDMTGWYLTDDSTVPNMWQFTAGPVLAPGAYEIIFASEKTQAENPGNYPYWDGSYFHTNFSLKAGGNYLGLNFPDQSVAYEFSDKYPEQVTDVSYGLFEGQLQYFANPTPRFPNESGSFGLVPDTKFSIDRGFYDDPFTVTITCDDPDATIWYTANSEEPTDADNNGKGQVTVSISETTVLKARASRPGWISSNVDTQTYIFVSDVKTQSLDGSAPDSHLPLDDRKWPEANYLTGSIGEQYMSYGMDPEVLNGLQAGEIENALLSLPSISISTNSDNLFGSVNGIYVNANMDGLDWERPASMELINPDGSEGFQVDMGIRIRGGWSRKDGNPKHAFRCFFCGKYGDSKLKYPLFGEEGVDEFDKIDLRCDQNHSWAFCHHNEASFCHELFTRDTQGDMGEPYTRSRYYHLYLNGHYWGLYQTQERSEARYAASYMGGEVEDYDVVKTGGINNTVEATDGNLDAYERLYEATVTTDLTSNANYFRAQGKNADGTDNPAYEKLVDIDNVIAYNLMVYYFGGKDYPITFKYNLGDVRINNLYAIYNKNNPDGWKFFIHDAEHTFDYQNGPTQDRTVFLAFGTTYPGYKYFNPQWLHQELMDNAEYQIAFADAVHKHMFNAGALTDARCDERLTERLAQLGYLDPATDPLGYAVVAESARWGDAVKTWGGGYQTCGQDSGDPYQPAAKANWLNGINKVKNFLGLNTGYTSRAIKVYGWIKARTELHYPSIDPPVFKVNDIEQYGGYITIGDTLSIQRSVAGSTPKYYTLDGSDPRLPGGDLNPAAIYGGFAVPLDKTVHVKARLVSDSTWSPLAEAIFADVKIPDSLRISEIMYNPADPNTEFIELKNIGTEAINLNLIKFTKGIDFTFGDQVLNPGEYTVVVQNMAAFQTRYPTVASADIAGQYTGRLDNDGDRVELKDALGTVIQNFKFEDGWYRITDGDGFSLTVIDADNADPTMYGDKDTWRASTMQGGSPASGDIGPIPGQIVINEVLAHTDGWPNDWIELHNTTDSVINIGGWYLSDDDSDDDSLMKYLIADGTTIPGGGYLVFTQDDHFGSAAFGKDAGCLTPFALSENGDMVCLTSSVGGVLTGFRVKEEFGASLNGVAFGRYHKTRTDTYNFVAMTLPTPGSLTNPNPYYQGAPNASPEVGPIVINEIMYNPADNGDAEYVELLNISGSAVSLNEWRFVDDGSDPTPGLDYHFSNIVLQPGEFLLLVKDLQAFTAEATAAGWNVPGNVTILEWVTGSLGNGGEKPQISLPGDIVGTERFYIRVDRVSYSDGSHPVGDDPWPTEPDGQGKSLTRIVPSDYGNDVANWQSATPTPGQ